MHISLTQIIAHRGNSATEPENTLRSFLRAEELGSQHIECDIQVCASGDLVVIHDDDVARVTNGVGKVALKTFEELAQLQCLYADGVMSDEKIPKLADVYDQLQPETHIFIEMKGAATGTALAHFLKDRMAHDNQVASRTLVSSFNKYELAIFRNLMPDIRTAVTVWGTPSDDEIALYASWGTHALHINHEYGDVTERLIHQVHAQGMQVHVYTVDSRELATQLLTLGADMIFTNDVLQYSGKHPHSYQQLPESPL